MGAPCGQQQRAGPWTHQPVWAKEGCAGSSRRLVSQQQADHGPAMLAAACCSDGLPFARLTALDDVSSFLLLLETRSQLFFAASVHFRLQSAG